MKQGLKVFFIPASDDFFVRANRAKIRPYEHIFNGLVYWRTPYVSGVGWGILCAYLISIVFGAWACVRALRARARNPVYLALLALMWLTVVYLTVVISLTEVSENQRIRFVIDPLVLALVVCALRDCWRLLASRRLQIRSAPG